MLNSLIQPTFELYVSFPFDVLESVQSGYKKPAL